MRSPVVNIVLTKSNLLWKCISANPQNNIVWWSATDRQIRPLTPVFTDREAVVLSGWSVCSSICYCGLTMTEYCGFHFRPFWFFLLPTEMNFYKGKVLNPTQLKRLAEHKYNSESLSLLDSVLQPWWNWLVGNIPLWVAPNFITIVGLIINIVTTLVLVWYSPDAKTEVSILNFLLPFIL